MPNKQHANLTIQVHEMHNGATRNRYDQHTMDTQKLQMKTAKNILELDRKFSTVYAQGDTLTQTTRSQSHQVSQRMDRKIVNIMKKIESRFNREAHKQKTEDIIRRMREKKAF